MKQLSVYEIQYKWITYVQFRIRISDVAAGQQFFRHPILVRTMQIPFVALANKIIKSIITTYTNWNAIGNSRKCIIM